MADEAHRVGTACSTCYQLGKPCNEFTRDVARNLNIQLLGAAAYGNADEMVAALRVHWKKLTRHEAILAAGKGAFIVAALPSVEFSQRPIVNRHQAGVAAQRGFSPATAGVAAPITEHGHVCVVIPGSQGGYPRVFSSCEGSEPYGKSRGDQPLAGFVFLHKDAERVEYFSPR